jgi:magnesium transporter
MSECRYFHVEAGKGLRRVDGLEEALACHQRGGYVWFHLLDPTRRDLDALARPLEIHPLTVEDCPDEDQVPKIEDYPGHILILFNRYAYADRELAVGEVDFLLGRNFLVTVNREGGDARRAFEKVEEMASHDIGTVEPDGDVPLPHQQPDGRRGQPDEQERPQAHPHHDRVHAPVAAGRDRRDV